VRIATLPIMLLTLAVAPAHAQTVAVFPGTPAFRYADLEIAAQPDSPGGAVLVRARGTGAAERIDLTLPVATVQAWMAHDPVAWIDAQQHDTTAEPALAVYPGGVLEGPTGQILLTAKHAATGSEYHLLVRTSDLMLGRILTADEALAVAYALRHAVHLAEGPQG
jgi:hypothetical protein